MSVASIIHVSVLYLFYLLPITAFAERHLLNTNALGAILILLELVYVEDNHITLYL
jgi:hypothetical protein